MSKDTTQFSIPEDGLVTLPEDNWGSIPIDNLTGLYLHEMGKNDLLTAAEEVQLAQAIEAGLIAAKRLEHDLLSDVVRYQLMQVQDEGEAARKHLILANRRLVVSIARKYARVYQSPGLHFLDLIQEGNIGLMVAVEKFDYCQGNRFSTYATWWIRLYVTRAMSKYGRTIRLPVRWSDDFRKVRQVEEELQQALKRRPTIAEMAEGMQVPDHHIRWLLVNSHQPLRLEASSREDNDGQFGDFIKDANAPMPAEIVAQNMLGQDLEEALNLLSLRENRILRLRYGLNDGTFRTLREVGEILGLTRERIRQLEKAAFDQLRNANVAGHLKEYLTSF